MTADYDRESDSAVQESDAEEKEKRKEQLLGESSQPKQKAMPMNPPALRLTPKIKALPQGLIDEETESDNYSDNRAPLSRRPTTKVSPPSIDESKWIRSNKPQRMTIRLLKESDHPDPFWPSDS